MKLSIITVHYNNKFNLIKTINSVKKQTWKSNIDYEYIVIDGQSNDGSIDLIKSEKVITKYVIEKDKGIYDAMNKGIDLAKGEFLTFLNAGDFYLNEKILEKIFNQSNIFEYDLVYGPVIVQRKKGKKLYIPKKFTKFNLYFWGTRTVCHQAMFVRQKIVGKYSNNYELKGELEWYFYLINIIKNYKIVNFPIVFYDPNGIGVKKWKKNIIEILHVVFSKNIIMGLLSLPLLLLTVIRKTLNNKK